MSHHLIDYLFFKQKQSKKNSLGVIKTSLLLLLTIFLTGNSNMQAQNVTVSGLVTAEDLGEPLPGVSVILKGTSVGTSTDFDGKFTINANDANATLEFSYLGYLTQEVKLEGRKSINIVLKPNLEALEEVVIIGYGTSKKSDLTGSVVTIGGEDIKKQSISSVAEALTGRLAGVQVTSSEGSPDAEINIRVRGGGSLTQDSSPLVIVDGFPINNLSDISPSDIETISVLKDASSTAIYGSRGANGVIIVTTKSGKSGKMSVSYNMFYGAKFLANKIDVLEPEDFVKWQYEYALLRNNVDSYESIFGQWQDYDQYVGLKGNDWQKQIYGNMGEVNSRDLGIRGGTDKINYNFSYTHYDEKTIMVGSNFRRDNLAFSLKSQLSNKLDLSLTFRYSDTEVNGGGANEQNEVSSQDARLRHSVGYSPIPLPGLTTTETDEAISNYLINPFVVVDDNQRRQLRKNFNMLGSLSWKVIENMKFRTDFGLDNRNDLDYRFYGRSTYYADNRPPVDLQGMPSLIFSDRKRESFRNANTLDYDLKNLLGENHQLKVLVGQEMIVSKDNRLTNEINGFPVGFDFNTAINLTPLGTPLNVDNFYSPEDKLFSFFGRVNYDFKNKYLFTATYRADGSSKFLGNNRWGYFPSAAVAWKIKEENFLKDVNWLNTLKVRLSYGQVGNNNIPTGQTTRIFVPTPTTFLNDINGFWGASNIMPNPALKWETTVTQNLGLDFDLFDQKVSGTFETYKNVTNDLLINFPVPGSGYISQYRNQGEIQNTGFEATININALEKEKYGLNFSFNVGVNKNRINSLGELEDFGASTGWASSQIGNDFLVSVGQPIGIMYGYLSDGRYEVSDFNYNEATGQYTLKEGVVDIISDIVDVRPGSIKLKDINGDGIVNGDDNTVIGNANPKHVGGMVINAYAHGFDLSAAFNWSVGNDVYNANKVEFNTSLENGQYRNLSTQMADGVRWTNLDPSTGLFVTDPAQLTALNANTTMWSPYMNRFVFSDWAVEDGSFLRCNTLTLGYSAPESIISKIGASKLRFYVTANNVFIITNYSGLDPEVSTRRRTPLTPGVDYSPFPRSRQFVFGLNLNF